MATLGSKSRSNVIPTRMFAPARPRAVSTRPGKGYQPILSDNDKRGKPFTAFAKKNCGRCFGRGYDGVVTTKAPGEISTHTGSKTCGCVRVVHDEVS